MYAAVENNSGTVPAFLVKLWTLVEDPSTDELIHWDASGTSFHVYDQQRFSREILPLYFKHNNIASFIRQLNMYGFRKVTHIDQGGLKIEKDDLQFQHQYFQRGERDMLQYIKRKVSAQAVRTTDHLVAAKTDEVSRILADVKQVKSKQESMDENLEYIKRENKLLWREVAMLRQKHHQQQEVVNKLIKFLVSIVNSSRTGLSIPAIRRVPLAINDVSQLAPNSTVSGQTTLGIQSGNNPNDSQPLMVPSHSPDDYREELRDNLAYTIESPKMSDLLLSPSLNINGPIIHELTDSPQTILVPVSSIGLANQTAVLPQQNTIQPNINSTQSPSASTTKTASIVMIPAVQSHPSNTAVMLGSPGEPLNFLMSPKIEAGMSLEDALNFGLNVPSGSNAASPVITATANSPQAGINQKQKRKAPAESVIESGATPAKRSTPSPQTATAAPRQPVSDAQMTSLNNIMMANSGLNSSSTTGESNPDASLAVAFPKDNNDEFTLSSGQLDLLSSDLDGLRGILQDHYKVDPSFLMELFDSSNPWPVIPDKDLGVKSEQVKDELSISEADHGAITGTELVEYNPRDELFPELMDDNIIGDIDDID